ncbi:hypothetical protein PT300_03085 [Enterobacteriaceae bacterium ESL0689]|nr:hypothetical protein [Enterobacteriaceae bacterium ESL0689]
MPIIAAISPEERRLMRLEKTKYPISDDQVRYRLFWLLQRLSGLR